MREGTERSLLGRERSFISALCGLYGHSSSHRMILLLQERELLLSIQETFRGRISPQWARFYPLKSKVYEYGPLNCPQNIRQPWKYKPLSGRCGQNITYISQGRTSPQVSLNTKDSEIMSPPCTSRPCIWSKICHPVSLEFKQGSSHQNCCRINIKLFMKLLLLSPIPYCHIACQEPDPHPSLSWVQGTLEKGLLSGVKRHSYRTNQATVTPGSLHANQQQEITTNTIRFPLCLYQCKWLYSFL